MLIFAVQLIFYLLVVRPTCGFAPSLNTRKWDTNQRCDQLYNKQLLFRLQATPSTASSSRVCRARDLIQSLVQFEKCYTTEAGARVFGEACAINVVYEDRFEPQPFVGKTQVTQRMLEKVAQRQGKGSLRLDRISDGNRACGFAWTWTTQEEEGLRGTTYCELNEQGEIVFVCEIPEPIFKPGDTARDLLEALTKGAEYPAPQEYEVRTPTVAHELAQYLYIDMQKADREKRLDELSRFFDENVVYRDFNYEQPMRGLAQVRKFVQDFSFPGIEFRPLRFDDGVDSTCFMWEVILDGMSSSDEAIKGLSFFQLDPVTRKIVYARDVPESAIKPPILGKWARQLRPGLGVFQGVPIGSRPGGL